VEESELEKVIVVPELKYRKCTLNLARLWWPIRHYRPESASEFDYLRRIIIKYYLKEYFGIDVQMKVIDYEFWILSLHFDSPMLSPIFYYIF
jgi:hypothetical protein